jgi:hypothetical protein
VLFYLVYGTVSKLRPSVRWYMSVELYWQGKFDVLTEKPVPVPLCSPQILYGLTEARTRASVVRGRRLTAWEKSRLFVMLLLQTGSHVTWSFFFFFTKSVIEKLHCFSSINISMPYLIRVLIRVHVPSCCQQDAVCCTFLIFLLQVADGDVDPEWTLLYYLRNKCILYDDWMDAWVVWAVTRYRVWIYVLSILN